ncbi:3-hydroxyisobutyrate dehydrogenase [Cantharellus anzutake]|uniref:3-hydroxyisobutyrate dehydrogenase n=1 Tax=Cantharellus anzutake TaxID=1750568 RepID=UPI001902C91B|nr:3-hydroxyisobutyrate dehydrogenase [Cantharellus anzutake]KAF8321444.1 3-hydroxyisobutyrate dehydrogenase [Cantharellus anzutake]
MSVTRIGFIGLGQMGLEMAQNLFLKISKSSVSGNAFVVCDPSPKSVERISAFCKENIPGHRLDVEPNPLEVTKKADAIFTMLPSTPQVKAVYLGESGVLQALNSLRSSHASRSPRLFVDSTTLDVQFARETAKQITDAGAQMVDAPVSGGVVGARAGTLTFMVGGPKVAFERSRPFLDMMSSRAIHCGQSGTGLIAKLCNNHILGINQAAIAEGMLLGLSLGLEPSLLASIINSSTARSWSSEVNNPVQGALKDKSPPCERGYLDGFASKLMLKDMLLASDAAKPVNVPLPVGERALKLYEEMIHADDHGTTWSHNGALLPRKDSDFSIVYDYLMQLQVPLRHP